MSQPIFHIVGHRHWQAACELGSYAPESLAAEGFVHFSYADQVARTANARFADQDGLIVVEFDPARLAAPVVDEDLYGAGELFPHVYGAIPTAAATGSHQLVREPTGQYAFDGGR
ncbi:MAG: DUF952 domain-containing protein [Jatrophihabitantaceae bacterium]